MNKQHILDCKELMQEAADRINLKVLLEEEEDSKFLKIKLQNEYKEIVYFAYDPSFIIGFINGIEYMLNK